MLSSYIIISVLTSIIGLRFFYEFANSIRVKDFMVILIVSFIPIVNIFFGIISLFSLKFWENISTSLSKFMDYKIIKKNNGK